MSSKERRNLSSIMELEDLPESNHGRPIDGSCSILKRVEENPIVTYTPIPLLLSFSNLTYSVRIRQKPGRNPNTLSPVPEPAEASGKFWKKKTKTKTLLDDISGEARDGEILAILGASGSGKSTLIDALAGRMSSLKGSVKLNGEALESRLLRVISAYVMQDDLLLPMLTVEETLMFSAEFRLPRALSRSKKRARVQALIDQLGLRSAANTIIGDESHRGVSGGERRRVSIGIDIIHDPIILFLDEPTSGLDSTSAYMVVKVLQLIAQRGSVVVMSIHQPSSRILSLLDSLIILSRGRTVYTGPPSSLPLFFSEFGHPIPENENRTEFALDLIRELEERSSVGAEDLVEFHRSWRRRRLPQNSDPDFGDLSLNDAISTSISRGKLVLGAESGGDTGKIPDFANPFWVETAVLARRSYINSRRMPEQFAVRLGAMLVTGFIFATIFWRVDYSPRGVTERVGFFALAVSTTFYMCAESLPVFVQNRYIFMRETAYNSYRLFSYLLANALVSIPSQVFLSLAFSAETFWAVGLAGGMRGFLFYFFAMVASFWAGSSFVTFLSAFVSHVTLGYTVVIASLAHFVLLSGVFINRDRIPVYWVWLHYASLVKYPFQAVLDNEFGDTRRCFATGSQMFDSTPLGNLPESMKERLVKALGMSVGLNVTGATCIERGADILKREGVTDLSKWNCMWVLVGWGFLFRILFYLCLLLSSKNKRR